MKAARFYAPGDLRIEDVPAPQPRPGDVLVDVEVALTDGTDLKAFRRGHPLLLRESPSPFGHEFCGIDTATGRRVVAANSDADGTPGAELELLNGAYAERVVVPERIARVNLLPVPRGLAPEIAAMVEPLACCLRGVELGGVTNGKTVAILDAYTGRALWTFATQARVRSSWAGAPSDARSHPPSAPSRGTAVEPTSSSRRPEPRMRGAPRSTSSGPAEPSSSSAASRATQRSRSTRTGCTTRS